MPLTTLRFAAGETTKTVRVNVNGDTRPEANETVLLNLSAPTGVVVGDAQATGTIVDEEGQPIVYVGDGSVAEGHAGRRRWRSRFGSRWHPAAPSR